MTKRRSILFFVSALLLAAGCMSNGSGCAKNGPINTNPGCPGGAEGTPHGLSSDGRVDVTAAEAFPSRPSAAPPSGAEIAEACASYAACAAQAHESIYSLRAACLRGALELPQDPVSLNAAERAIPFGGANETFDYFVRTVLAARGDCDSIRGVLTQRSDTIDCQEDGCSSNAQYPVVVTCRGDVATLDMGSSTATRDCSHASAHCSEKSQTGCTDRGLVKCTAPAKDRCDGDVKLGCDHCGLVSFHDCAWNGGHCIETADGAKCVDAGDASTCFAAPNDCVGDELTTCVSGIAVNVDCASLGMHCEKLPTGAAHVGSDAGTDCGLAPCAAPVCVTGPRAGDAG